MNFPKINLIFLLCRIMALFILIGHQAHCAEYPDSTQGSWTKKTAFPSSSRNFGLGFSIGNKGYYGLGQKQTKPFVYKTYSDLWEYDPSSNSWTQKADFPGQGRLMMKGFSVDNKIYAGFGYVIAASGPNAGANDYQTDFYEFEPSENKWSKKNNALLGRGEIFFVADNIIFSVNPEFKTLNRYTATTDTWFEGKWENEDPAPTYTDLYGIDFCFTHAGKEYMISVFQKKGIITNQLWELDPHSIIWKQKNDLPFPGSDTVQTLTIGKKHCVITGGKKLFEYNPETDSWTFRKEISAEHKDYIPAFSLGTKNYGFSKFEFWEFTP